MLGQRQVVLPGSRLLGELLLAVGGDGAGLRVELLLGHRVAGLDETGPGRGVVRSQLRLTKRACLSLAYDWLAVVRPLSGERIENSAKAVTGADAEEHQAPAHQDGEPEVDPLDCAAAATAAKVEEHCEARGDRSRR